jgi:hypothetical protein
METCGLACEKMEISGCRSWKKFFAPFLEVINNADACVMSEEDALDISKRLEKQVRSEWGVCSDVFFRMPSVINFVIELGNRFEGNDKILENVISILHHSALRPSKMKTPLMYDFMLKHKDCKPNRAKRLIADTIPYFAEFDDYDKKWEYIMAIPKIAPKKDSRNVFRRVLENKSEQIPDELKPQIIAVLDNIIEKYNPLYCEKCRIFSLISDLGGERENIRCSRNCTNNGKVT